MKGRVQSRWYISAQDAELLAPTKRTYWLQCMDGERSFIEYAQKEDRAPCTQPLDVEVNLPMGRYCFGCGDKQVISPDTGRTVQQKVWFYVQKDGFHVCKYGELPSFEDLIPFDETDEEISNSECISPNNQNNSNGTYVPVIGSLFCGMYEDIRISSDTCPDCKLRSDATNMDCENCLLSYQLFRKIE